MGMAEYRDGTFGEIKPVNEALRDLLENQPEQERVKALHIGSLEELVEKARRPLSDVTEPLAEVLRAEFETLRMDVNKILIHLKLDDKTQILPVQDMPNMASAIVEEKDAPS